ncbi:pitrilysin family protein [Flavobacterium sp.]|uniref:M16 family metallopeptidase n=1 Tax=Flavobacterium sp. TaxID=239 RepID=UPI00262BFAE5|nr:pitrilysin family protein [Flavobacterium sp.]
MKSIIILSSLFLTMTTMQAQNDRPQPKPGPAPTVNVGKPQRFTLPNGLKVMVVENSKLPRVSFNLHIDNAPFVEGSKKGISELTGEMIGKGTQTISKDAFNEEIDFIGAEINFSSDGAYATGLSKYAGRILELMAQGCLNPNFTQEELDKEKAKLIEGLKSEEKSVASVAGRVENFLAFGKNHPDGEYLTEQSINNVSLTDLVQHYNTYFVPENAYLVVIGDVKFAEVKTKVQDAFESWTKASAPLLTYNDPKNVQYTQIDFVDMPNAVQSAISFVNTVSLKMTDKDYFAALLANQIFGGDFNSYLNMNLREKHGWTYGASSSIKGNKYVTKFKAASQVRNAVTDSAIVELLNEVKRIRTEKVTEEVLQNAKASYIGNFVMQIQKPETVARYALATETQKLPADFYENYIKSMNAVTIDQVTEAAKKYFLSDNARIVVVGKGSEILPALEKTKIPMFFFDKYGNAVEKPKVNIPVPAGVTAKTVFTNYINAVGGEKALKAVKSIVTLASGTVQGMPVELTSKITSDKKSFLEMKAMGMSMMKRVVGDKSGYEVQQGQRKDFSKEELLEKKNEVSPFDELALITKTDLKIDGIEALNGAEAYVIKDGKSTFYYDTKTFLKVAEGKTSERGTQMTYFSNYKEVKGIKFPHEVDLNVGIEIKLLTSDVKINEGVTSADFQ